MSSMFTRQETYDLSTIVFLIQAYIEKGNKYQAYQELEKVKRIGDVPAELTRALDVIIKESF